MQNSTFNRQQFSVLFHNAEIGIIAVNSEGKIEAVNKCVVREFGYDEEELLHQDVELLIPAHLREKHIALRENFSRHPTSMSLPIEKHLKGLRKNGTEFPIEMSLGYFKECEEIYFVAFVNDIEKKEEAEATIRQLNDDLDQRVRESTRSLHATVDQLSRQIKENERKDEELLKALEKEKELNELKSRFVSVASHEFRTPLSGILASTYLLSKYTKEDEQAHRDKHIKRILTSVNLLNEVLGDFLSVDKMEQESFKPNRTNFDVNGMVDEMMQGTQHMLKSGQHFSFAHGQQSIQAYLDQSMFRHILTNLLSNAIKYSPEDSSIDIVVEHKDNTLTVKVKDQGIGIPIKEQQNLYRRFFRSPNAAQVQGTGLGLNIVKKYVDVMDGTIECISDENKGAEFIVTFNNQNQNHENSISS